MEVKFAVYRMGTVSGIIYGYDTRGYPVPLSWAIASTNLRSTPSLDGSYRLYLPEGTYVVRYSAPMYVDQTSTPITIVGSSSYARDVILVQQ